MTDVWNGSWRPSSASRAGDGESRDESRGERDVIRGGSVLITATRYVRRSRENHWADCGHRSRLRDDLHFFYSSETIVIIDSFETIAFESSGIRGPL